MRKISFLGFLGIALGLSMDTAAVSMADGAIYRNIKFIHTVYFSVLFGFFQALLPVLGYFAVGFFSYYLVNYAGIIVFFILTVIGLRLIHSALHPKITVVKPKKDLTLTTVVLQAIATSIDAFSVGIGFKILNSQITSAAVIIGITTAAVSMASFMIGKKFGDLLGSKAQITGGVILIFMGLKALF